MVSEEVARDNEKGIHDAHRILSLLSRHCKDFGSRSTFEVFPKLDGNRAYQYLDKIAGYDGLQIGRSAIRGFALRVQVEKNYRTFTVREDRPTGAITEYEKRIMSVERGQDGYMFPHWTIQSYVDQTGGNILSIGVAKTREFYPWIKQTELNGHRFKRNHPHDAEEIFLVVPWDMYRMSGLFFYEYTLCLPDIEMSEPERIVVDPNAKGWQLL
jgi:hypothetical protein